MLAGSSAQAQTFCTNDAAFDRLRGMHSLSFAEMVWGQALQDPPTVRAIPHAWQHIPHKGVASLICAHALPVEKSATSLRSVLSKSIAAEESSAADAVMQPFGWYPSFTHNQCYMVKLDGAVCCCPSQAGTDKAMQRDQPYQLLIIDDRHESHLSWRPFHCLQACKHTHHSCQAMMLLLL